MKRHHLACGLARIFALVVGTALSATVAGAQSRSFQDEDLANKSFVGQALDGADFSGATLRSASFYQASLRGAIFREADLHNTGFGKADLTGADFTGARLGYNVWDEANLSQANLEGVDFKGPSGFRVNFRGAILKGTRNWFICTACDFRGADLRGANLLGLMESPDSNFRGATYDDSTRWPRWFDPQTAGVRRVD